VFYYQADSTGNVHTDNAVRGNITSANQITFSRATSSGTISGHWWVVEDTGTNWDVDRVDVTVTGTTNAVLFDAVNMNKTMVVGSYSGGNLDDIIDGGASIYLSSPTQITVVRGGTDDTIDATVYIIEFSGETMVQRGEISYNGFQTSLTDPISSVSLGDSMAWIPTGWINTGHCTSEGTGSSDNLDVMIRARLTSDSVITGERNNNGGNDAVLHWEVVEWERVANKINLEEQWTIVRDYYLGAEIALRTGSFNGSEPLRVDFWNSSNQWMTLGNLSANSWNNYTIGSFITSENFTIRLKGTIDAVDTVKDSWQIDASIIRLLGKADGEIPVNSDSSDVDSSLNIGVHSNFTAHKSGPDASYDVLTETKYLNTTLVDEEGFEGTWVPSGWSSTGGWSNETDQAHNGLVSADIDGVVNITLIDNESFESLLKRFNKRVQQDRILSEVRRREYFEKPSIKRKRKEAAKKRKSARASKGALRR